MIHFLFSLFVVKFHILPLPQVFKVFFHQADEVFQWFVLLRGFVVQAQRQQQYLENLRCAVQDPLTEDEMERIRRADKNCRLIKGQVFLWPGADGWEDLWDMGS